MSLTSQIRYVRGLDSAATDGSGKTGLASGDFTAKYLTEGGTLTALTPETVTTLGTYQAPSDAAHVRIRELSSSDPCKGVYEVHFHNTQVAASGVKMWLFLSAAGAAFQPLELDLADVAQTGDSFARLGAPAGASVSADVAAVKSDTAAILTDVNTGAGAIYSTLTNGTFGLSALHTQIGTPMQVGSVTVGGYATGQDPATLVGALVIEGSYTLTQCARGWNSALFAKYAGRGTNNVLVRDVGDSKNRLSWTIDSGGNITGVTLNLS